MVPLYFPKFVLSFALFAQAVGTLHTFIAAVYEHAVILPNKTETAVSKEEALLLMHKNIDVLEKAIKLAAKQLSLVFMSGIDMDLPLDKDMDI